MNIFTKWGLPQTATRNDITRAYRRRAQILHPDKPTGSQESFCQLQQEYAFLLDPSSSRIVEPPVYGVVDQVVGPNIPVMNVTVRVPLKKIATGCSVPLRVTVVKDCCRHPACQYCRGTGQHPWVRHLNVDVPIGTYPRHDIVIKEKGHITDNGVGDLCVTILWARSHGWHYNEAMTNHIIVPQFWEKKIYLRTPHGTIGSFVLPSPVTQPMLVSLNIRWPSAVYVKVCPVLGWRAWVALIRQSVLKVRAGLPWDV